MAPFGTDARFSLTQAMVELLALGLSLDEVVPMVTSRCAETLEPEGELGTLRVGEWLMSRCSPTNAGAGC